MSEKATAATGDLGGCVRTCAIFGCAVDQRGGEQESRWIFVERWGGSTSAERGNRAQAFFFASAKNMPGDQDACMCSWAFGASGDGRTAVFVWPRCVSRAHLKTSQLESCAEPLFSGGPNRMNIWQKRRANASGEDGRVQEQAGTSLPVRGNVSPS